MHASLKMAAAAAGAAVVSLGLLAGTAAGATSQTIKVCVNKKSGEMRYLTKKKCGKGWKKITWNMQGPPGAPGATGASGPQLTVKDKTGATVGPFMGSHYGSFFVLRDGGLYEYGLGGSWIDGDRSNYSIYFTDAGCTSPAYAFASNPWMLAEYTGNAGSAVRFVAHAYGSGAPVAAYRFPGGHTPIVAANLYFKDDNTIGTPCTLAGGSPFTGELFSLEAVTAPPLQPGPLTVS